MRLGAQEDSNRHANYLMQKGKGLVSKADTHRCAHRDVTKSVRFRSQWGVRAPEPHAVLDTACLTRLD